MATRRRKRIDGDAERAIQRLVILEMGPTQIHHELVKLQEHGQLSDVPTLRTVQRIVADMTRNRGGDPWDMVEAEPEDVGLLLDTLAAVIDATEGRVKQLTRDDARWVVRLAAARPELTPLDAWKVGRYYQLLRADGQPTDHLDHWLAYAEWRGPEHDRRYFRAFLKGWVVNTTRDQPGITTPELSVQADGFPWRDEQWSWEMDAAEGSDTYHVSTAINPEGSDDER